LVGAFLRERRGIMTRANRDGKLEVQSTLLGASAKPSGWKKT
jgi:hypothetical protein